MASVVEFSFHRIHLLLTGTHNRQGPLQERATLCDEQQNEITVN
jgi:hypothetical protein